MITNGKSHIGFQMTKIIDFGWSWRVITHYGMPVVRHCG